MRTLRKRFDQDDAIAYKQANAWLHHTSDSRNKMPQALLEFYKRTGLNHLNQAIHFTIFCKQADFMMSEKGPKVKIDYTEKVFSHCTRLAFIDSKMHGISFQGLDRWMDEQGSMIGVLAKVIKLFCVKGAEMDQAALVTWLSEAIFLPNSLSHMNVTWTSETDDRIAASLIRDQMQVKVIFTFEDGLLRKVETEDRYMTEGKSFRRVPWCTYFDNYRECEGLLLPTFIQTKWLLPEGEFIYFESNQVKFEYK